MKYILIDPFDGNLKHKHRIYAGIKLKFIIHYVQSNREDYSLEKDERNTPQPPRFHLRINAEKMPRLKIENSNFPERTNRKKSITPRLNETKAAAAEVFSSHLSRKQPSQGAGIIFVNVN